MKAAKRNAYRRHRNFSRTTSDLYTDHEAGEPEGAYNINKLIINEFILYIKD